MTQAMRINKGCFGISDRRLHHIDNEIYFKTCIGNFFSSWVLHYLELFSRFSAGMLPFPGAISEQPSKVMEIFRVIETYRNQKILKEQQAEKLKRKVKAHGR